MNTTIVLWVLGVACASLGWFARQIWSAVQALKQEMSDFRVLVAKEYIAYDRLQDALKPIMDSLHEIKTTLAGKADK